jgi:hypothetical protein
MKKISLLFILILSLSACKKEFIDKNEVTEKAAYETPEAYPGIVLGMTKIFTTTTLKNIIKGPGLTAKEFGRANTYTTTTQLSNGGEDITDDNAAVSGIWSGLNRSKGIAEKVLSKIDNVNFVNPDEKVAYKAYAQFFKGMTIGYMSHYWEKVTVNNDADNKAEFVDRMTAYQDAINYLNDAQQAFGNNSNAASIINNLVSAEFSIIDVIHALKARYYIELGNNQEAYNEANAVDLTKRSVWSYDGGAIKNPVYEQLLDPGATLNFKSFDKLGLLTAHIPDAGDGRIDFYLDNTVLMQDIDCGYDLYNPEGFWTAANSPIPVYLPGEMMLIKAEAKARMGGAANLAEAVTLINDVRTKTSASDIFGVGANLPAWTGNAGDATAVLDEVYRNYAAELYLQGLRFPIHRRFFPNYLDNIDWNSVNRCQLERVNNFYPYPDSERANNPNCPSNPAY